MYRMECGSSGAVFWRAASRTARGARRLHGIVSKKIRRCEIFPCIAAQSAYLSESRRTRTCLWPLWLCNDVTRPFWKIRSTVGRSREGGRYGCTTTQGRSALARRYTSADQGSARQRWSSFRRTQQSNLRRSSSARRIAPVTGLRPLASSPSRFAGAAAQRTICAPAAR
jgi:hypothetical protein